MRGYLDTLLEALEQWQRAPTLASAPVIALAPADLAGIVSMAVDDAPPTVMK
jgi:hypothetical protein